LKHERKSNRTVNSVSFLPYKLVGQSSINFREIDIIRDPKQRTMRLQGSYSFIIEKFTFRQITV